MRVECLRHQYETGLLRSEPFDGLGKVGETAGQSVDLVDDDDINHPRVNIAKQCLEIRALHVAPREAAVVVVTWNETPAFVTLAQDVGRSEEHTSELQSLMRISYAVFCLKKKTKQQK